MVSSLVWRSSALEVDRERCLAVKCRSTIVRFLARREWVQLAGRNPDIVEHRLAPKNVVTVTVKRTKRRFYSRSGRWLVAASYIVASHIKRSTVGVGHSPTLFEALACSPRFHLLESGRTKRKVSIVLCVRAFKRRSWPPQSCFRTAAMAA